MVASEYIVDACVKSALGLSLVLCYSVQIRRFWNMTPSVWLCFWFSIGRRPPVAIAGSAMALSDPNYYHQQQNHHQMIPAAAGAATTAAAAAAAAAAIDRYAIGVAGGGGPAVSTLLGTGLQNVRRLVLPPIRVVFHRIGLLCSVLILVNSLDPNGSLGLIPIAVSRTLQNQVVGIITFQFGHWLVYSLVSMYRQVHERPPPLGVLLFVSCTPLVCGLVLSILTYAFDRYTFWALANSLSQTVLLIQMFVAAFVYVRFRQRVTAALATVRVISPPPPMPIPLTATQYANTTTAAVSPTPMAGITDVMVLPTSARHPPFIRTLSPVAGTVFPLFSYENEFEAFKRIFGREFDVKLQYSAVKYRTERTANPHAPLKQIARIRCDVHHPTVRTESIRFGGGTGGSGSRSSRSRRGGCCRERFRN